jgi:hypothetical protein
MEKEGFPVNIRAESDRWELMQRTYCAPTTTCFLHENERICPTRRR